MDNTLPAPQPDPRILERFPYPVAYPYSLIFDADEKPSIRRWALCFTEYQALRLVCLPLVSRAPAALRAETLRTVRGLAESTRARLLQEWVV